HKEHHDSPLVGYILKYLSAARIDMEGKVRGDPSAVQDAADGHQVAEGGVGRAADDYLVNMQTGDLPDRHHIVRRRGTGYQRLDAGEVDFIFFVVAAARIGGQF